jgi:YidC/Oxa1 family membrane protein insertase
LGEGGKMNFLYTLVVFPLVQIIELCYLFVYRIFHNPGTALFAVSIAVSTLTLPLYFCAEKWQEAEREIQKRLSPKIKNIKAVFKGDEQYMMLSTFYRQNRYHPVYAMRSTFGLFIQIPFFIAAYSYLSHLKILEGSPFLFIRDLGAPDALIPIGGGMNLLPVLMTLINCVSGAIYTKDLAPRDRVQVYGTAFIFLALLYNSPAGLVLYWTLNNIFSLVKNILVKIKNAGRWIYGVVFAGAVLIDVYVIFFHPGDLPNRIFAFALFSMVFLVPLAVKIPAWVSPAGRIVTRDAFYNHRCFILSLLILLLLAGFIVPSSLIASSVEEFSFLGDDASPFPFILYTFLQAAGVFVFWPLCIYLLFSRRSRELLSVFITLLAFGAFVNVFLADENFGFLTNTLIFSEPKPPAAGSMTAYLFNMAVLAAAVALILYLIFTGKKVLLFSFQAIILASLLCFGAATLVKISGDYTALEDLKENAGAHDDDNAAFYRLSKTEKNVLLIMLDAAVSGYVPYIFEEKPELASDFEGFTWYPNCVSFAGHTLVGAPPVFGGYEYTPEEINRRNAVPLAEKHQEAYLLLPRIFSEAGYSATVTDPPFDNYQMSNLSVFAAYPQIRADNLSGKYTSRWQNAHPDIQGVNIADLLRNNLIRFSFFKTTPLLLRFFIYNDGKWLSTSSLRSGNILPNQLTNTFINDYAFMDLLPSLTSISDTGGTYTAIYCHLPHDGALLQLPDYVPSNNTVNYGNSRFPGSGIYHVNMASFLLLGKFFRFLKDEGIYDNTRIILAADHGRGHHDYENNVMLPNGQNFLSYQPLLMVKDFYAQYDEGAGEVKHDELETGEGKIAGPEIDNSFMTNADAVLFALKDIVKDPVNPFTRQPLQSRKADGVNLVTISPLSSYRHTKYQYNIGKDQWLHVHDNIFDPANWEKVNK